MSEKYKLPYKIKDKYCQELSDIEYRIHNMEIGNIYGYNGNNSRMDGSLEHNCNELRKEFFTLLSKIQNGLDSREDKIFEIFSEKEL